MVWLVSHLIFNASLTAKVKTRKNTTDHITSKNLIPRYDASLSVLRGLGNNEIE